MESEDEQLDQIALLEQGELECSDFEQLVGSYLDGELLPALGERFEAHAKSCECCAELLADIQHLVQTARTLADEPIPDQTRLRLRQALRERVGHSV